LIEDVLIDFEIGEIVVILFVGEFVEFVENFDELVDEVVDVFVDELVDEVVDMLVDEFVDEVGAWVGWRLCVCLLGDLWLLGLSCYPGGFCLLGCWLRVFGFALYYWV